MKTKRAGQVKQNENKFLCRELELGFAGDQPA